MNEFEFIKAIRSTRTLADICRDLKLDYANVYYGRTKKENLGKVADELRIEVLKSYAYVKEYDAYVK